MGSGYWRVEFISTKPGDDRCVLLHGQLEETVGPMTMEMAEAWIDRFDNQERVKGAAVSDPAASGVPAPKLKLPKRKPAG
jgi:hypothetical protein